jgi:hypothetical protein
MQQQDDKEQTNDRHGGQARELKYDIFHQSGVPRVMASERSLGQLLAPVKTGALVHAAVKLALIQLAETGVYTDMQPRVQQQ